MSCMHADTTHVLNNFLAGGAESTRAFMKVTAEVPLKVQRFGESPWCCAVPCVAVRVLCRAMCVLWCAMSAAGMHPHHRHRRQSPLNSARQRTSCENQ